LRRPSDGIRQTSVERDRARRLISNDTTEVPALNERGEIMAGVVQETIDSFPFSSAPACVWRRESLLCAPPHEGPFKLWRDHQPLAAVHFPQEFVKQKFAPPRGVFEGVSIRIEWQTMDNRQPFYHRNVDADELSYQIDGERYLITELGTIEHSPGDFSRIPVGVAHDNLGMRESHLLFYVTAPVRELRSPARRSRPVLPPFPGWKEAPANELVTDHLGTPGTDVAAFPIDEQLLLTHGASVDDRINLVHGSYAPGSTEWLYGSDSVLIGCHMFEHDEKRRYVRHLNCDEIQYQVAGRRTILSQRGRLDLEPGDFVQIPAGTAFANSGDSASRYIRIVSTDGIERVADAAKEARPMADELQATSE
jgi:uncharacterized cupin superfamily protein